MQVQKRDVALAIILSIVTCGFYTIYWFIKMTDEVNIVTGNPNDTNGVTAFIFTLVTCGIYGYYWVYKMGDKIDKHEGTNSSKGILYFLLMFFGLAIISYALIQDGINKAVSNNNAPPTV